MIVDNADDDQIFCNSANDSSDYIPFSRKGAILFTTRNSEAPISYGADPNVIEVEDMTDAEARELLEKNLRDKRQLENEQGTKKLLKLLVNLPLAIMQAAAYLNAKKQRLRSI